MKRRKFLQNSSLIAAGMMAAPVFGKAGLSPNRKFRVSLHPYAIGVKINQEEMIDKAVEHNFEAILPVPNQLQEMSGDQLNAFLSKMKEKNLSWDAAGLPVDFRKDEGLFRDELKKLPQAAKILRKAGADRVSTWVMPTHETLSYMENFKQHSQRLREAGKILADEGIRFGLEYVGTRNLKIRARYPFVGTMKEMLELIDAIDLPNMGLQLDSFHWYCSRETVEDIEKLKNRQVVTCDLNDATAGRTIDEQIDGERQLPGDSGLIDLKGFMAALIKIGYDGPVRAEPFNAALNDMENDEALAATSKAMWRTVNLV
ncbi:sugar phosphate isomerase/epimerase family protein [Negadavirga shengliensis]|uniref:Sugar phosphate isomerase/epimerase family protein n=1 Tax=Negadavirga shengliensis TaxID=1389218 RepID=A0ABV9T515_9BACT